MTVTRTGTATRVNEAGLVELVPYNLLSRSEEFDNASWVKTHSTETPNATTAPDGTMTADSITSTPSALSYIKQNTTQPAGTYTLSFFVKPQLGIGRIHLELFTNNPSSHYFDLDLGVVTGSGDSTFTITPYPNGWYRCTATRTFASSILGTGAIYLAVYGPASLTTIFFWGAQLVEGSSALTYQKTVDRLDIPRIDYTGGGCPSILLEPLRVNQAKYSQQFDVSGTWIQTNSPTITPNTHTAPDGTFTACTFTAGAASAQIQQVYTTGTSGVSYTGSVYIKRLFGSGDVRIRVSENANETITVTSDWTRVSFTATSTTSNLIRIGFNISTIGDSVAIWGAQLEEGAYPTSYIPTTIGTVSRVADAISKTGISDLIGQTEGVMFIESAALFNDLTQRGTSISDGTGNNRLIIYYNLVSNQILVWGTANGVTFPSVISYSVTDETEFAKIAVRYRANDISLWVNGYKRGADITSQALPISFNRFGFDSGNGGSNLFAKVKSAQLYKTYLSNDEMAALTTL
jgi:hypothetical protein